MNRRTGVGSVGMGWAVLCGVIGLSGCSTEPTEVGELKAAGIARQSVQALPTVACPEPGEIEVRHVLHLLIDRSGSYFTSEEMVRQMKTEAERYINELPPSSAVFVSYISHASARPQELVIKDIIPAESAEVDCDLKNPFDRSKRQHCAKVKQQREAQLACIQAAHRRIQKAIEDLVPVKAPRTDVTGGLTMAGEILSAYPQAERAVVVLSDGVDTEKKPLPTEVQGLSGTTVVFRPPLGQTGVGEKTPIAKYVEAIAHWGGKPSVVSLNIPVPAQLFQNATSAVPDQDVSAIDVAHR